MASATETLEYVETQFITFCADEPFILESGKTLSPITVAYETYGTLNASGTNAILICHALSGSAHAAEWSSPYDTEPGWWDALIGPGKSFDTDRFFIICSNILGSCYGTTGPSSTNPKTGEMYRASFPAVTVRDIVRVQKLLLDALDVRQIATVCGSSLGGMQVLEWAALYPEMCSTIIPISAPAAQSTWCIALNAIARAAITGDPAWNNGGYDRQPATGLGIARMVGMVSYRTAEELDARFGRKKQNPEDDVLDAANPFQVESYLHHQGKKLSRRFDANTYLALSHATDSHDLGRGRGPIEDVLANISAKALCIGVSSDIRYPVREQKYLARGIPFARYAEIQSIHGHDAFLIEYDQLGALITEFLACEHEKGGTQ